MRRLLGRPLFWVLVVVASLLAVLAVLRARGPEVESALVARRDLEQHLIASGRVWVPTRLQISSQAPGLVLVVGAVEGQHVARGDLLIQLDDREARAAVAQAQAAVEQATARVEQLRRVGAIVASEGLRQAQANYEQAASAFERTRTLADQGAMTQAELDEARRALEIARAQKGVAEAQQVAATPRGADSRVALAALLEAQARLDGASVRLEQTRVIAQQPGVILSREVEPGDVVQPTRVLMVMAVDADTQLVVYPDERNLGSMALGQQALAAADAYPDQTFPAQVSYLAPAIDPQRGSIEVRLTTPRPPAFLKPDMTVSVDLTVAAKKGVLTVPAEAVRGLASGAPWVWRLDGERVRRREVKLGLRGDGTVEVREGLAEGDEIVVETGQLLRDGQRVRAARD